MIARIHQHLQKLKVLPPPCWYQCGEGYGNDHFSMLAISKLDEVCWFNNKTSRAVEKAILHSSSFSTSLLVFPCSCHSHRAASSYAIRCAINLQAWLPTLRQCLIITIESLLGSDSAAYYRKGSNPTIQFPCPCHSV